MKANLLPNLPQQVFVLLGCAINILAAIGVIFLNKHIFISYRVQTMTLTAAQMAITALGLFLCWQLKMFTLKSISLYHMLPIATVFCGFIVFSNLSLEYNTVGTYQLFKGLTTPVLVLISWQCYKGKYSKMVIASIVPVIIGVYTHSIHDIKLTFFGASVAIVGVLSAALYQLWIGVKLEELDMNPQQLLFYQAPLSVTLLIPFIVFYEKIPHYESFEERQKAILVVTTSSIIGFILNISTYWVIKYT
jgi:solute carrier family 35 protein E3